jgi:outer membrane receptor protein involved in Fe transport
MNNRSGRVSLFLAAGALSAGSNLMSSTGYAQTTDGTADKLEEVVITAERRTSDVQRTAASVSVRNGNNLLEQGKFSTQQILEDIPNTMVTAAGYAIGSDTSGDSIAIRGVQSNAVNSAVSSPPATAVYTDGIYEGFGGDYDLDRVEVLRGPQGTLYGRSATAGVVAFHTRNPSLDGVHSDASVELGDYGLQHYTAAVNLPLGDALAIRLAGDRHQQNGYYSGDRGDNSQTSGRLKVLYQPNEDFSLLVGASLQDKRLHVGDQGNLSGIGQVNYTPYPFLGAGATTSRQYWLELNWNLQFATLTYQPALRTWYDNDKEPVFGPFGNTLAAVNQMPLDQFITHELRLASRPEGRLTWQGGLFYYDNRLNSLSNTIWYSSNALVMSELIRKKTQDLGVFGEATLAFTDTWRLTGGVRYDYTDVQATDTRATNLNQFCNVNAPPSSIPAGCVAGPANSPDAGLPVLESSLSLSGDEGRRRFYNTNYKARLEHDLTPTNLVYGAYSTGFLPGDVQIAVGAGGNPVARPYAEETLTSFEVGSKNRFFNQTVQINGDVFYYRYGGYQQVLQPNPVDPASSFVIAVPARMFGGELETAFQLTAQDRLTLSYSYTNAYYANEPTIFAENVTQSHVVGIVPQMATAGFDHSFRLPNGSTINAHADGRWLAPYDLQALTSSELAAGWEPYVHVGNEIIGDVSGTWTSQRGHYSVTGYVRNVSDNRYLTAAGLQSLSPITGTGSLYDPRTYGMVLSIHW